MDIGEPETRLEVMGELQKFLKNPVKYNIKNKLTRDLYDSEKEWKESLDGSCFSGEEAMEQFAEKFSLGYTGYEIDLPILGQTHMLGIAKLSSGRFLGFQMMNGLVDYWYSSEKPSSENIQKHIKKLYGNFPEDFDEELFSEQFSSSLKI